MEFYCETYHEKRDSEHCCFCSAICGQYPNSETNADSEKKTMRQHSEKITIVFTYDEEPLEKLGARVLKRRMDVYGDGETVKNELLFSETESVGAGFGYTKSGVAGAVNLLYGLLFDRGRTYYYVNDEYALLDELANKLQCRRAYDRENCGCVGKRLNLFRKLRFKMLQLKVQFFNVFK